MWTKGEIKYVCEKCGKEIAKELGEIKDGTEAILYVTCKKCYESADS